MSVNGTFVEIKWVDSTVNVHILAFASVPFRLTTVQVPNLSLTHTKRITVHVGMAYCQFKTEGRSMGHPRSGL